MKTRGEELAERGRFGERAAELWMKMLGYEIIERNFGCRFGEIDIIASKDGYICFVEVKTRERGSLVSAEEAVDLNKRKRLTLTAQYYLQRRPSELQPRFDVAAVERLGSEYTVKNYIENAF